jgi:acyl-CoA reductase-like NAD-dependent aldehyde dehydrogenase
MSLDSDGYFITPTIIDNPKDDSKLVTEEPFGMAAGNFGFS